MDSGRSDGSDAIRLERSPRVSKTPTRSSSASSHSVSADVGGAAERLRTKFGLGDSERLLDSFLCAYDPKPAMHIRGRVHVFSSHLCFAGRLGAHTSELVLPFSEVVSLQQEVRHRFFLGRLARVITVITVDREYSFSTFLSPERALRAMLDVWEPMQTSVAREGIDEEDDAGAGVDPVPAGCIWSETAEIGGTSFGKSGGRKSSSIRPRRTRASSL